MPTGKWCLNSPTLALFMEDSRHVARTVPAGAIITVDRVEGEKLVEVTWNDKKVLMFAQDIRARGGKLNQISN